MTRRTAISSRSAVNLPAPVLERIRGHLDDVTVLQRGGRLEARPWSSVEGRGLDEASQTAQLAGYSTSFDKPYEVFGGKDSMWGWDETMVAGSWTKTLAEGDDILFLENHAGRALARVSNGTLELSEDELGVLNVVTLNVRRTDAMDVYLAVEDRAMFEMSCAFRVTRQEWNEDYTERWITEVIGYDSSIVNYPANPNTLMIANADDLSAAAVEPRRGMSVRAARLELERMRRLAG